MKGRKKSESSDNEAAVRADWLQHEIGNVLQGLLGMTQMLRACGGERDREQWLVGIEQAAAQLVRLMHGAHPRGLEILDAIDGLSLLEEVILCHAPAVCAADREIVLTVDPALPRAWKLDHCLLRQVLDNLVVNSLRHARGTVAVEAGIAASNSLELTVHDAGPRGQKGGASRGQGLGLQLSAAAVRAMDGRISARYGRDRGEVKLRFPAALPARACTTQSKTALVGRGLYYELELPAMLHSSVEQWLRRLGLRPAADGCMEKQLRLSSCPQRGQDGLILQLGSERCTVTPPILESNLAAAILELATAWRAGVRRGSPG